MLKKLTAIALGLFMSTGLFADPAQFDGKTSADAKTFYESQRTALKAQLETLNADLKAVQNNASSTEQEILEKMNLANAKQTEIDNLKIDYDVWRDYRKAAKKTLNETIKNERTTLNSTAKTELKALRDSEKAEELILSTQKKDLQAAKKTSTTDLRATHKTQKETQKSNQAKELADLKVKLDGGTLSNGTVITKGGEGSLSQTEYDAQLVITKRNQAAAKTQLSTNQKTEKTELKTNTTAAINAKKNELTTMKTEHKQEITNKRAEITQRKAAAKADWEARKAVYK